MFNIQQLVCRYFSLFYKTMCQIFSLYLLHFYEGMCLKHSVSTIVLLLVLLSGVAENPGTPQSGVEPD